MDTGERGMNPVATTIINPWKEYWLSWGSKQRHLILKSGTLPTAMGQSILGNSNENPHHRAWKRSMNLEYHDSLISRALT